MTELSAVARAVGARVDFSVGLFTGSLWSFLLIGQFGRNSLGVDLALFASYVAAYSVGWAGVSWMARPRVGSAYPAGAVNSSLFVVLSLSLYLFGLLGFYLPARGVTWLAVGATCLALALIWSGRSYFASSPLARYAPSSKLLTGLSLILLTVLLGCLLWERGAPIGSPRARPITLAPSERTTGNPSVTVLGADGVDWVLLNRLIAQDLLPNTKRLLHESAAAPLQTFTDKSPLIWTSIATGVTPEAHGVLDFVWPYFRGTEVFLPHSRFDFLGKAAARLIDYREMRPFSSSNRKARAIWEIASLLGRRVLMVNWWATYPAETMNGAVVSDYAFPSERIDRDELETLSRIGRLAYPPEIQRVSFDAMTDFVGERRVEISEDPGMPATERNAFFVVRDQLASEVFRALNDSSFDLRLLFLNAADAPSHVYTFDVFGESINEIREPRVSEEEAEQLWNALVIDAYLRLDEEVRRILEDVSDDDYFLIVSDHGWSYDGTSHWRRPEGVMIVRGPGIRKNERLQPAHVYDVFPTLCYLLALPISGEVEGKVVWNALQDDFVRLNPPTTIESYGNRSDAGLTSMTDLDRDHMERLRALGYVE